MSGMPADATALRRSVTHHLAHWWAAGHCRPGDRVVELTADGSGVLPFLIARGTDLHSLTVLHLGDPPPMDHPPAPFPIVSRHRDPSRAWPVAGPVDLILDVDAIVDDNAAHTAEAVPGSLRDGAELLTLHGRIVTATSTARADPRPRVGAARLLLDDVRGLALRDVGDEVEREILGRFGKTGVELVRALARRCPAGLLEPIVASVLESAATTVLCTYRRSR